MPNEWRTFATVHLPLIARFPSEDRERLYHLMQLFLKEVPFEGCAGLQITDVIRVTVAAHACLLLLRMPYPRFNRVRRILVYPAAFVPKTAAIPRSGQIVHPDLPASGQAWQSGIVVLGWDEVEAGAVGATDGYNVVLHEFAHMLDAEDGRMDGVPVLDSSDDYDRWVSLWKTQFDEHVARIERGDQTVLDSYGAESRAEFFAVATEAFYEKPLELKNDQPGLYALLTDYFRVDPAA